MESFAIEPTHIPENVVQESSRTNTANLVLNVPEPPSIWEKLSLSMKEAILPRGNKSFSLLRWTISALRGLFPVLQWGRQYDFKSFRGDLMAGVTLASLGIPQVIHYMSSLVLADTSVVPPLVYAVMGSSRELAIGPVAVVSLLLSSMVQKVVDPTVDPIAYTKLVFTVTLFAGIFQASFGLFRLGFLVDFLSHAAIVGFMAGAAIVIGAQQLKGLLGITHFTNNTDVVSVAKSVWLAVHHHFRRQ